MNNEPNASTNLPAPLRSDTPALIVEGITLPSLILAAGEEAARTFLNFFIASIRNRHTRRAYARHASAGSRELLCKRLHECPMTRRLIGLGLAQ